jgi:hypothetical protein
LSNTTESLRTSSSSRSTRCSSPRSSRRPDRARSPPVHPARAASASASSSHTTDHPPTPSKFRPPANAASVLGAPAAWPGTRKRRQTCRARSYTFYHEASSAQSDRSASCSRSRRVSHGPHRTATCAQSADYSRSCSVIRFEGWSANGSFLPNICRPRRRAADGRPTGDDTRIGQFWSWQSSAVARQVRSASLGACLHAVLVHGVDRHPRRLRPGRRRAQPCCSGPAATCMFWCAPGRFRSGCRRDDGVLVEEADELSAGVRPVRVGVGPVRDTAGPGMSALVDDPAFG